MRQRQTGRRRDRENQTERGRRTETTHDRLVKLKELCITGRCSRERKERHRDRE